MFLKKFSLFDDMFLMCFLKPNGFKKGELLHGEKPKQKMSYHQNSLILF